ncbi:MAG: slipin family protein [Planctomycetota bacterium]
MMKRIKIRNFELGLRFLDGEFHSVMEPGRYLVFNPRRRIKVDIVSQRNPWIEHEQLDMIVRSGELDGRAKVLDLKDYQRAIVWVDGRFQRVLGPGLFAYWLGMRDVRAEVVDARNVRFQHQDLNVISRVPGVSTHLDICDVGRQNQAALFIDGSFEKVVGPGQYAFWKGIAEARLVEVDTREQMVDVSGQEIMTADKVTLRINAVATYRLVDIEKSLSLTGDYRQSLYREVQLALREIVGSIDLDSFLINKDDVASGIEENVQMRTEKLGLEVLSVGIRDVILPGDMKDLMNRVTEAKKAAEANLIARREETAAMRSQANTAKLLADNPTLMRLRELEILEKIAASGNLNIVMSDKGLADRVVNLL